MISSMLIYVFQRSFSPTNDKFYNTTRGYTEIAMYPIKRENWIHTFKPKDLPSSKRGTNLINICLPKEKQIIQKKIEEAYARQSERDFMWLKPIMVWKNFLNDRNRERCSMITIREKKKKKDLWWLSLENRKSQNSVINTIREKNHMVGSRAFEKKLQGWTKWIHEKKHMVGWRGFEKKHRKVGSSGLKKKKHGLMMMVGRKIEKIVNSQAYTKAKKFSSWFLWNTFFLSFGLSIVM